MMLLISYLFFYSNDLKKYGSFSSCFDHRLLEVSNAIKRCVNLGSKVTLRHLSSPGESKLIFVISARRKLILISNTLMSSFIHCIIKPENKIPFDYNPEYFEN